MSGSLVTDAGQTIVSGALPLALGLAALAGLVSFASPCVLPLVPGSLGFVSGMAAGDRASSRRWRTAVGALLFVAGFTAVFVLMALFVTSVGRGLWEHKDLLMRLGGGLVIVLGLVFLGVGRSIGTQRDTRLRWRPRAGLLGAPVLGGIFALGWAPCTGPTLAAVLILATSTQGASSARGLALTVAYCLGLGIPFLLAAVAADRFAPVQRWLARHRRGIQVFGGVLLIAIGLLLVTGWWDWLTTWLQTELIDNFVVPL